jgi:uncharacterized membrane protein
VAAFEPPAAFLAPGEAQVWLAAPGEYILWHNYRTVHDGRSFDRPPKMPDGTRFRVHGPDGDTILLRGYGGMSSEGADGSSLSVGRFAAAQPGPHRVAVEGTFEARVMAVGPDRLWPIARLVGQVFVIVVLGLGLAIAAGLYGFLRAVDVPARAAVQGEAEASLRKLVGLVYGLQAASLLVGITLFAGVIVNYLRRGEAAGTWLESHVTWQIRTFWWSLAWCALGVATAVLMVGFLILAASALWFVYRIVKGWSELNEGRPMDR